jgi:hypothetical protein
VCYLLVVTLRQRGNSMSTALTVFVAALVLTTLVNLPVALLILASFWLVKKVQRG